MPSVLITTDFSNVSRHSLDYACTLLQGKDVSIDLLHVYSIPVSYTADGVAVSAISYGLDFSAERMEEEVAYVQSTYPSLKIAGRVITGNLVECLQDETRMRKPMFVVLGTAGFADFAIGEDDPLNALRSVSVPVLFIPFGTAIKPISRVAYACDYAGVGPHTPVSDIVQWVTFIQAQLQVVHADAGDRGADDKQTKGEQWLKAQLLPLQPEFNWEKNPDVLNGLTSFLAAHQIDCLAMVPKKYGMWERLFRQSRTKALARLNRIPVIAFNPR